MELTHRSVALLGCIVSLGSWALLASAEEGASSLFRLTVEDGRVAGSRGLRNICVSPSVNKMSGSSTSRCNGPIPLPAHSGSSSSSPLFLHLVVDLHLVLDTPVKKRKEKKFKMEFANLEDPRVHILLPPAVHAHVSVHVSVHVSQGPAFMLSCAALKQHHRHIPVRQHAAKSSERESGHFS
ncbi:hypothetical protein EYF80_040366 [Liparis tanakae]|uniref:Uncharacterized protein n=1 Tax=Liparis tanakae TaxID=230148 RepID=A0A4Z2G858_9TELE|nr:hypothetical protein EYF80_040366 [Liparis tanakae]